MSLAEILRSDDGFGPGELKKWVETGKGDLPNIQQTAEDQALVYRGNVMSMTTDLLDQMSPEHRAMFLREQRRIRAEQARLDWLLLSPSPIEKLDPISNVEPVDQSSVLPSS